MSLGRRAAVIIPGCCWLGVTRVGGLSGWVLGPVMAVGPGLRSLGSLGRCLVCAARWWGGGSVALGIFGLQGFSLREFFGERKISDLLLSCVWSGFQLFMTNGITRSQPRSQPS